MDAVGVAIGEKDMVLVSGDCVNGEVRVKECVRGNRSSKEPVLDCFELAKRTDCGRKLMGITLESEVKSALIMLPDMTEREIESWISEEGSRYIEWPEREFYIEHMCRREYRYDTSSPMAMYLVALAKKDVFDAAKGMRLLGQNTRVIDYWEAGFFDLFKTRKDFAIVSLYESKASLRLWDEHVVVDWQVIEAEPKIVAEQLEQWDNRVKEVNGVGLSGVMFFWHATRPMAEDLQLADWLAIEDHFCAPVLVPISWNPEGGEDFTKRDMTLMHAVGTLVRVLTRGKALWATDGNGRS